jgi:hypothetical protein
LHSIADIAKIREKYSDAKLLRGLADIGHALTPEAGYSKFPWIKRTTITFPLQVG